MDHRAVAASAGRWHDRNGILKFEAHQRFRTELHLLPFGDGVCTRTGTRTGCGRDGCAFAATEDATEDRAYGCAAAYFLSGILAPGCAFALPVVGGNLIRLAVEADFLGIQHER